jgi:outer membrane autotransporter protein
MCGISVSALLSVVPMGASAQNVVISANDLDGAVFGSINSFSNPGFSLTDLPDGGAGLEIADIAGGFSNSGLIAGGDFGALILGDIGGSVFNDGALRSDDYGYGIFVDGNIGGDFTNTGEITTAYGYAAVGISGNIGGNFHNSGIIINDALNDESYGYYGVYIGGSVFGDFTNSGTIFSDYYIGVLVQEKVGGNFHNSGDIIGGYYGVGIWGGVDGDFTNSGNITAGINGPTASDYTYVGVYIGGDVGGNFTNTGNIMVDQGYYYGVLIGGDLGGDFTNTGNITFGGENALYYAVFVDGDVMGNFTNSGLIEVQDDGYYGVIIDDNVGGDFTNSGTIRGAHDYYGVVIAGDLMGDFINTGLITNADGDPDTTYINNLVNGNITTPVNQGVIANDADISGKMVTGAVRGFVADGTTWDALRVNDTFVNDGLAQMYGSTSALVGITGEITGGDTVELTTATASLGSVLQGGKGLGLSSTAQMLIDQAEMGGVGSLVAVERQLIDLLYRQGTGVGLGEVLASYSPAGSQAGFAGIGAANQSFIDLLALRTGSLGGGQGNSFGLSLDGSDGYQNNAWAQGIGAFSSQSASGGVGSFDTNTAGFAVGVDQNNGEGLLYGFGLSVAATNVDGRNADNDITSFMPALYARYNPEEWSGWYVSGVLAANRSNIDQSRFNLFNNETLKAEYDGYSVTVRGEVGTDIAVREFTVTPFISGTYAYTDIDGYNETGGISALSVSASDDARYAVEVGAKLSATHGDMTFNATLGYREDFDSGDVDVNSTLSGANVFDTNYELKTSGVFGSLDVVFNATEDIKIKTGVGGVVGEDYNSINGTIKVIKSF